MLIMKNKLTHTLRSLPVGSVLTRKGTTQVPNEGYFHLQFPNSGPTQGCQNVTGCRLSLSACTLQDSGELHSLTERDSSFPCSTPGTVPLVPTCIQELISLSQPVYRQAGDYEKHKRQYLTHNVQIIVTRVREIQREECNGAHSPNPESMLLLDPSLIPHPCLTVFQEKGAPDDNCLPFYTVCKAQDDVH